MALLHAAHCAVDRLHAHTRPAPQLVGRWQLVRAHPTLEALPVIRKLTQKEGQLVLAQPLCAVGRHPVQLQMHPRPPLAQAPLVCVVERAAQVALDLARELAQDGGARGVAALRVLVGLLEKLPHFELDVLHELCLVWVAPHVVRVRRAALPTTLVRLRRVGLRAARQQRPLHLFPRPHARLSLAYAAQLRPQPRTDAAKGADDKCTERQPTCGAKRSGGAAWQDGARETSFEDEPRTEADAHRADRDCGDDKRDGTLCDVRLAYLVHLDRDASSPVACARHQSGGTVFRGWLQAVGLSQAGDGWYDR